MTELFTVTYYRILTENACGIISKIGLNPQSFHTGSTVKAEYRDTLRMWTNLDRKFSKVNAKGLAKPETIGILTYLVCDKKAKEKLYLRRILAALFHLKVLMMTGKASN